MIVPVRKCYYLLKLALLLVIVVAVLTFFEKYRGGKRGATAYNGFDNDILERDFERQIREDEALIIPGLGEDGQAAYLEGEDRRLGKESEKKLAINVHLSDRISYNRSLPDTRNEACKRVLYDAELPSASVVIIFHNEPYSVVLRTVWSVLNSMQRDQPWFQKANYLDRKGKRMTLGYPGQDPTSPYVYLKEIILVDDNSTLPELRGKLDYYVRTRLPRRMVRVVRIPERRGLMSARMSGARAARGDVLMFLDAHCEMQADWLRPLLQRLRHKKDAAVTPIIDVIDQSTFKLDSAEEFQVGGFTFSGHFTWIDVSEREKRRRGSDIAPTWSPTMAGGLFAMERAYFWQLGAYDEQMAGWGGENLEMSFRVWQCGGSVETVPCARAGHVFRSFHPYAAARDSLAANTARAAEVWMDRHKELYYLWRPDLRKSPIVGDVTHRRVLREKLKCKSFQWYLDHVYPEKFVPIQDTTAFGRFRNPSSRLCLDSLQHASPAPLGLYPCHPALQPAQMFALSAGGQLRDEERCATLQHQREPSSGGRRVLMVACRPNQRSLRWRLLPSDQLQHESTGLCLTARGGSEASEAGSEASEARAEPCEDGPQQVWRADLAGAEMILEDGNNVVTNEQLAELRKLKKHRRVPRSPPSPSPRAPPRSAPPLPRRRRSRPSANKFVLRLQREQPGSTLQHVEAHILCPHEKLFANNTLVRDLVQILNRHDIQVVNNGRVFHKSGVTDLSEWERLHPRPAAAAATPPPPPHVTPRSSLEDPGSVAAPPPPAPSKQHKSSKKHKHRHHSHRGKAEKHEHADDRPIARDRPETLEETEKSQHNKKHQHADHEKLTSRHSSAEHDHDDKSPRHSTEDTPKHDKHKKTRHSSTESDADLKSKKSRYSDDENELKPKKQRHFSIETDTEPKSKKKSRDSSHENELKSTKQQHSSIETDEPKSEKKSRDWSHEKEMKPKKTRHSSESDVEKPKKHFSEKTKPKKYRKPSKDASKEVDPDFKSPKKLRHSNEFETKSPKNTRFLTTEVKNDKNKPHHSEEDEYKPKKSRHSHEIDSEPSKSGPFSDSDVDKTEKSHISDSEEPKKKPLNSIEEDDTHKKSYQYDSDSKSKKSLLSSVETEVKSFKKLDVSSEFPRQKVPNKPVGGSNEELEPPEPLEPPGPEELADSKSSEGWRVGVSRFRVVPSSPRPPDGRELALDANDKGKTMRSSGARDPPEVLVRGNLTFELDESMVGFRAASNSDEASSLFEASPASEAERDSLQDTSLSESDSESE